MPEINVKLRIIDILYEQQGTDGKPCRTPDLLNFPKANKFAWRLYFLFVFVKILRKQASLFGLNLF